MLKLDFWGENKPKIDPPSPLEILLGDWWFYVCSLRLCSSVLDKP